MTDSPTGEMRRSLDATMSPASENRDSRCAGKNETHYTKDILGDLGASPVNNVASSTAADSTVMEASVDACERPSADAASTRVADEVSDNGGASGSGQSAGADLISAVPGTVDGMNEYLMQHMRTLLNPLLVGGGGRPPNATESSQHHHHHHHHHHHSGDRPLGPPSSGGSSSDDENDVLVWRLPPTEAEARLLQEVAPAPHDVSGDFIDIDMVTPSNHSMDGTSSMDEDPFGMIQNNLDGDDDDDDDEGGGYEEVGEANAELGAGVGGERLDPFLRRVEGSSGADQLVADEMVPSRRNSGVSGGGSGGPEPFNNLSLNLLAAERSSVTPVKSQSSEGSGSRMNVTSSEEYPSPPAPPLPPQPPQPPSLASTTALHPNVSTSSTCSVNAPHTPMSMSQAERPFADVDSPCDCANFLWSETLNSPYVGAEEQVMLWSAQEVEEKRYFGLGDSSLSGPTALANVLSVFNLHHQISIRAVRNATPCAPGAAAVVEEGVQLGQFLLR